MHRSCDHPPARRSVSSPIAAAAVAPALLWFSGRTGSTWLSSLLAAHAEVRFHGEVLNPHNSGSDAATLGAWLDAQAASAAAAGQRVVGFKFGRGSSARGGTRARSTPTTARLRSRCCAAAGSA